MLAYVDTFSGLVPCKLICRGGTGIKVRVTATRGAYKRGSEHIFAYRVVVPRKCIRRRKYSTRIIYDPEANRKMLENVPYYY